MSEIELGDKVRDIYTGFVGHAVSRTEFINGCVQFGVVPRWTKDKNPMEMEIGIDQGSLEVVSKKKKKEERESSGGPMTRIQRRNY